MFARDSGVSILFEQCFVDRRGVFARDSGVSILFYTLSSRSERCVC